MACAALSQSPLRGGDLAGRSFVWMLYSLFFHFPFTRYTLIRHDQFSPPDVLCFTTALVRMLYNALPRRVMRDSHSYFFRRFEK